MTLHPIAPVFDEGAEILILGSFPSVKSREGMFFYHHPQNRFWRVLAAVYACALPQSIEEKRTLLLAHRLALWDVIASCDVTGSADSSIRNVVPNDLSRILQAAPIRAILCNGATAFSLYQRYCRPQTGREARKLPSTSPANAAWSLERLTAAWGEALR